MFVYKEGIKKQLSKAVLMNRVFTVHLNFLQGPCREGSKAVATAQLPPRLPKAAPAPPVGYPPLSRGGHKFSTCFISAYRRQVEAAWPEGSFEYFNAWMFRLAASIHAASTVATSAAQQTPGSTAASTPSNSEAVQLKTGGDPGGIHYPTFRFYSPAARAYLVKSNGTREVVAQGRDPFSRASRFPCKC